MPTTRLLPWQFGPGITADATRIEASLRELVGLYNEVPPDLVRRRWTPSWQIWGYSPDNTAAPRVLPYLRCINSATAFANREPPTTADITNLQRVKSCAVPTISPNNGSQDLYTWEVALVSSRPTIIAGLVVFAEAHAAGPYTNVWEYGAVPPALPPGLVAGDPTTDFTLQACVDDAWDMQNRKKLRQEALVWRMRSDAFNYNPDGAGAVDTLQPAMPQGAFGSPCKAVSVETLVLVPALGRVRFQWTIPLYGNVNNSTWGASPQAGNAWNIAALVLEATR